MSEAKHTPGPWSIGNSAGYNASHVYHDEDGVCTVYGIFSHQSVKQVADDPRCAEGLANARLIAAAPDMLAEHEAIARLLSLVIHDLQGRVERDKLAALSQCLDRSQSAIAKATGAA